MSQESNKSFQVIEELYHLLFENMRKGVAVYEATENGEDFILIDFNKAAETIEGIKKEELIGKCVTEVFPGVIEFGLLEVFRRVWQTGTPENHPISQYKDNRISGWRENNVYKLRSGEIVTIYDDITEIKQAEEALKVQQELLNRSQELAHLGSWHLDINKNILTWSDETYRIFGLTPQEFDATYEAFMDKIHPDDREMVDRTYTNAIKNKTPYECIHRIIRNDGEVRVVLEKSTDVVDEHGETIHSFGFTQDITEQKKAEDALRHSEAELASIIENSAIGIAISDLQGKIIRTNSAYQKMFGFSMDELKNMFFSNFTHPDYVGKHYASYEKLVAGDIDHFNMRKLFVHKDGHNVWANVTVSLVKDDNQNSLFIIGMVEDITEHKRAEDELNRSRARLQSILNTAPTGIGMVSNRVLVEVNGRICDMTGYTEDELIGKSSRVLYPTQEEFEFVGRGKYRQIAEQGIGTVETRWIKKDGSILNVLLSSSPINPDDLSVGVTFTATDITERIQVEAEKEKLEEQLRQSQKMEAVGTLAGGIAHDFNNILTIIAGNAEFAFDDIPADNPARENIEEISKATIRARDLVGQILAFSRKEKKELIPIKPQSLIKETLKFLRSTTPTTISIVQSISGDCGKIMADPTSLHQLLMNLFTNAVHAMDEKGEISVSLQEVNLDSDDLGQLSTTIMFFSSKAPGTYVRLSVTDSGTGMDEETVARIFDPFFTTKEVGKGTGMGLSVVHGIVESHDGFIAVESNPGHGSTFSAYFPVTKEDQEEVIDAKAETSQVTGKERILFVDDEENLLVLGKQMLGKLGYEVTVENSSILALEKFKADPGRFDLIITDQAMPNMSGSELVAEILKVRPDMPVILSTGFSSKVSEENAKEKGISKFIKKPYTKKIMAGAVREVLDAKL